MCLSTVYTTKYADENIIMQDVSTIDFDQDDIIFTNFMGEETRVTGKLKTVNLVSGYVIVIPA